MSSARMTKRLVAGTLTGGATHVFRVGESEAVGGDFVHGVSLEDLMALVRSELRRSFEAGHPASVELFRGALERADAQPQNWLALIVAEWQIRKQFGPPPSVDEYVGRFPELASQLPAIFARTDFLNIADSGEREPGPGENLSSLFSAPSSQSSPSTLTGATPPTRLEQIAIPGYEILGVLGRGGMGVVYKARQLGADRLVALKMVLAGMHADERDLARLRREAEAVSALKHPNIVEVYEIGEHDGRPFYAMEYVAGGTLASRITGRPQPPAIAAETIETVARAMHAAHEQHIVHRDLKPANILMAEAGGRRADPQSAIRHPPSEIPKITDFGLATRVGGSARLTTSGLVAGTPQYMAPELMTPGGQDSVGPATDIYSLGSILYEMLTGRPPFLGVSPAEIVQQVLRQEPISIRQLQPRTPRNLETICLKCLRKEPSGRYATAADLADELGRFRAGKAIAARPIGKWEQAVRWQRLNPALAFLLLLVVVTLSAGVGATAWFAVDAAAHARRAEENEKEARRLEFAAEQTADALRIEKASLDQANLLLSATHRELGAALEQVSAARREEERLKTEAQDRERLRARELFDAEMLQAQRAWETGHVAQTRRLLSAHEPTRHDQPDVRGFEWHYLSRLANADGVRFSVPEGCLSVAAAPDGKRVMWAFRKGCEVWDMTGAPSRIGALGDDANEQHRNPVDRVVCDPTGKLIATGARDKTIKLWDAKSFKLRHTLAAGEYTPTALRFSPDGRFIAACVTNKGRPSMAGTLCVWDTATGDKKWSVEAHAGAAYDLSYSADGVQIASAGYDSCVRIWEAGSGAPIITLPLPTSVAARSVAFAPRGRWLAAGTSKGEIRVWDRTTWKLERQLRGHVNWVYALAFAPDGVNLASGGSDQLVKIWDVANALERRTYRGHTSAVTDVVWLPGRPWVLSASLDQSVKGWNIAEDPEHLTITGLKGSLANFHMLPGGRQFVIAASTGVVAVWDMQPARAVASADFRDKLPANVFSSSLAPDGRELVFVRGAVGDDTSGEIFTWDLKSEQPTFLELPGLARGVRHVAHSSDGKRLATGHVDGTVQVHFLDRSAAPLTWKIAGKAVNDVRFSPNNPDHVLVVGVEGAPCLYDSRNPQVRRNFNGHARPPRVAAFSADGARLATGGIDQFACVWDFKTGKLLYTLAGHTGAVRSVAFSPDGERLLTGSDDLTLKLWDLGTGRETLTLRGHSREVTQAFFAPDGRQILSAGLDWSVRIWDAGPPSDRELLRAAAAACRLTSFAIDGPARAGAQVTVKGELANASGRAWPTPPKHASETPHRTMLRLFAEPFHGGAPQPDKKKLLGRSAFVPEQALAEDYRRPVSFSAVLQLPPGRHRLTLELGWQGDEIIPIDEKILDVIVTAP